MVNIGLGNSSNFIIAIGIIILLVIIYKIYFSKPNESFQNIPLDNTKMLLIADSSGNIETVPLSELISYLRSIETEITQNNNSVVTSRAELSSKITKLESDLQSFITTINQQLSNYQGGATSGAVDAVKNDLQLFKASAESQLYTLRNDVNSNKTNIASNLAKFNTLSSDLSAFKTTTTATLNSIANTYMKLGSAYKIKLGSNFITSLIQQN